jgi:hypothetical protein
VPVYLVDFPNHGKVRKALASVFTRRSLAKYDAAVSSTVRSYLRLAAAQLRVATASGTNGDAWRTLVSRAYYAAYNASKAVRLYVYGFTANDASDHKNVGELPDDFPTHAQWTSKLIDMRFDRNVADYEPWPGSKAKLKKIPPTTLTDAQQFVTAVRVYLKGKGV